MPTPSDGRGRARDGAADGVMRPGRGVTVVGGRSAREALGGPGYEKGGAGEAEINGCLEARGGSIAAVVRQDLHIGAWRIKRGKRRQRQGSNSEGDLATVAHGRDATVNAAGAQSGIVAVVG